jgi:hypothetical protein
MLTYPPSLPSLFAVLSPAKEIMIIIIGIILASQAQQDPLPTAANRTDDPPRSSLAME